MNNHSVKSHTDTIAAILLFAVFAFCAIFVLLSGAGVYGRISNRDSASRRLRTAEMYITSKIKSAENSDAVSIAVLGDSPALRITETVNGIDCCTYIYHYNGYIMEIYTTLGSGTYPASGEKLIAADSLSFSFSERLLTADIAVNDSVQSRLFLNTVSASEECA